MRRSTLTVLAAIGIFLLSTERPQSVFAQTGRRAAKVHHDKAVNHYNVGRFEEAIVEFQKAYDLEPHPTLLFNIGKAHERAGNPGPAMFFFRRYLQMAPEAKDTAEVRDRIRDLEARLANQDESRTAQASTPPAPTMTTTPTSVPAPPSAAHSAPRAESIRISAEAGGTFLSLAGGREQALEGATLFAGRFATEYALQLSGVRIDLGLAVTFSPLVYETRESGAKTTSYLLGAFLTSTLRYPLAERLSLAVSVGAGIVWWSGLGEGHPFTEDGKALGSVPMPSARVSTGIVWQLMDSAFLGFIPALTYSKTTGGVLPDEISSVRRLELGVMVGLAI